MNLVEAAEYARAYSNIGETPTVRHGNTEAFYDINAGLCWVSRGVVPAHLDNLDGWEIINQWMETRSHDAAITAVKNGTEVEVLLCGWYKVNQNLSGLLYANGLVLITMVNRKFRIRK